MKNLLKEFGHIFNPNGQHFVDQVECEKRINEVTIYWNTFKNIPPDNDLFRAYDDLIDANLEILRIEYGWIPDWKEEYERHSESYYDKMKFQVHSGHFTLNLN